MTNRTIDYLGDEIRAGLHTSDPEVLNKLESYRRTFKSPLSQMFKELCRIKYKIGKDTIVTYRIKRFESIINKVQRFPKMRFNRMWDIGGCRCIVKNDYESYKLFNLIQETFNVKKIKNYLEQQSDDGYRSLHVYATLKDDETKVIEIQIRNQKDHNWATLVEISDLLYDAGLKEYGKDKKLSRFHKLLSMENLTIPEKKEIASIVKKYGYVDKLNEVFKRNQLQVREQWLKIQTKGRHKYFLIETSKNKVPKIDAYENFDDAENDYFSKYKKNQKANIVLTHLQKPVFHQISIAYSNYILTMHSFQNESSDIFESLIIDALKTGKYFEFLRYFDLFQTIVITRLSNSIYEKVHLETVAKNLPGQERRNIIKKQKEWEKDIDRERKELNKKMNSFRKVFIKNLPKNQYKQYFVRIIIKYVFWKQHRQLKKIRTIKKAA